MILFVTSGTHLWNRYPEQAVVQLVTIGWLKTNKNLSGSNMALGTPDGADELF